MSSLILITVSGNDHPGITAKLMKTIERNGHRVVDLGQSVTHGFLSLSILLDSEGNEGPVLKDLLFEAKNLNLSLEFQLVENKKDFEISSEEIYVLSCVSTEDLSASFIGEVAKTLAFHQINIQRIDNTTKMFNSLEITALSPPQTDWKKVKADLMKLSGEFKVDLAFLKDNIYRRSKRLIVFDMDSTLIQSEVIDELAAEAGKHKEIQKLTSQAMNGEIPFAQSLETRVKLLKGLPTQSLSEVLKRLKLNPGVEDFIQTVKGLGFKVALISGGFSYFTEAFKQRLNLDYAFGNELEIKNDQLTGNVTGTLIDPNQKAILLDLIAQQESISLEQVVAIGDGANDLPMLSKAGLGIAFHAKDIVKENAEHNMSHGPMTSILYFLGIPGPELTRD